MRYFCFINCYLTEKYDYLAYYLFRIKQIGLSVLYILLIVRLAIKKSRKRLKHFEHRQTDDLPLFLTTQKRMLTRLCSSHDLFSWCTYF